MKTFADLGLEESLLKVLNEKGFEQPTEIQEKAIPTLLEKDTDTIGLAQTGTGKTAAFALPLISNINVNNNFIQGLILAPTRELANQIAEQVKMFCKNLKEVKTTIVYGGAPITNQIKALKKQNHIVIATPGRLIDLIKRRAIKLNQLKYLVLDEADEMLNMGFKEEIDEILQYVPEEKNIWLFSATMPKSIRKIVDTYMSNPFEIKVAAKNEVNANIIHQYAIVSQHNKFEALKRIIDVTDDLYSVVFCRTKRETQDLAERLLADNYKADALHGDLPQPQRERVMGRFRKKQITILVCTDVAARGIDVNNLTHVFHHSLPDEIAYYTHRSGRTARAGKEGTSISFIKSSERNRIDKIQNILKIKFDKIFIPHSSEVADKKLSRWVQKILDKNFSGISDKAAKKIIPLFDEVSKEDLILKLLSVELEKIQNQSSQNLNEKEQSSSRKGRRGSSRYDKKKRFDKKKRPERRKKKFFESDKKKNKSSNPFQFEKKSKSKKRKNRR